MARPVAPDDDAAILRLYGEGLVPRQIAETLGRSKLAIISRLRVLQDKASNPALYVEQPGQVAKRRRCLRCGKPIMSTWYGDRYCEPCRHYVHAGGAA